MIFYLLLSYLRYPSLFFLSCCERARFSFSHDRALESKKEGHSLIKKWSRFEVPFSHGMRMFQTGRRLLLSTFDSFDEPEENRRSSTFVFCSFCFFENIRCADSSSRKLLDAVRAGHPH